MKYYVITGEASGDLHASNLIRAIQHFDDDAIIYAWGGDQLSKAGANLRMHYRDTAFMGFWEVAKNLGRILKNFRFCKRDINTFLPDVIVFVDYPGFNLRMAKWAKSKHFKTAYYISPQIWAWHSSRAKTIKYAVDRMITILPFEKEFYHQHQIEVDFVGHPLLDIISGTNDVNDFRQKYALGTENILALLPGSRPQEVQRILPKMLQAANHVHDYQIAIALSPAIEPEFYNDLVEKWSSKTVFFIENDMRQLLANADFAWVTSGTATLETALQGVPQIVCYAGDPFSVWIARKLVQIPFISLVNLIMEKEIVPELIQQDCHPDNILQHFHRINSNSKLEELSNNYKLLKEKLGGPGASEKAASIIVKLAKS